ncbi:MAG: glycosyl hydrolase-related protein [Candidatus Xenobia bacterium]
MQPVVWTISHAEMVENYETPGEPAEVCWPRTKWPMFQPSAADPAAGNRTHPARIEFVLEEVAPAYELEIQYLTVAPRLASLEVTVNGVRGTVWLDARPDAEPVRLQAGLHTTIHARGTARIVLPPLQCGENAMEIVARDEPPVLRVENPEAIKRLDRMANGAGIIYEKLSLHAQPTRPETQLSIHPTVLYREGKARAFARLALGAAIPSSKLHINDITLDVPAAAFGHLALPFDIPDGNGPYAYHAELNGQTFEGRVNRARKWTVYVAPHSHTDVGYTHRQSEVAEHHARAIDDAVRYEMQYHLDSSWPLESWLWTRDTPQLATRICIPHNYVNPLTWFAGLEDLIRNGEFSEAFLRPQQQRATYACVVDVPSITSAMPALLEGAGVRYLVHARNPDRGPFSMRPGPFWWEGPEGGRVLVWLSHMYCELSKVCGSPPTPEAAEPGLDLWLAAFERPDYAPDVVLLYGQEADNTDLDPQPKAFMDAWSWDWPRLVPCSVTQFFEDLETRFGAKLPTQCGDRGAYWEDGVVSSIETTIRARHAQANLPAAERLHALAGGRFPQSPFEAAWRDLLLFDEHTWGAFLSATDSESWLQQDRWSEKARHAVNADAAGRALLHAAACRHSLTWKTDGREVVVYNPHSWPVQGTAQVEIGTDEGIEDLPLRVVQTTATQRVVEFAVAAMPGLSYRRYRLHPSPPPDAPELSDEPEIENEHFRLRFDPELGSITSWMDRRTEVELTDTEDRWGLGHFVYARGGEGTRLIQSHAGLPEGNSELDGSWEADSWRVARTATDVRLVATGVVPCGRLEMTWRLPHGARYVDVEYILHKVETRAKEAAYVVFPLALPQARVLSDSQLAWVDWERDALPGACQEWLPLQTGILLDGMDVDVLIASPDIPLFCVGSHVQGRWGKPLQLSGGRILSYVLNNYWPTNYKASQGGEIRFRYRLFAAPRLSRADAFRAGWEARRPLYAHRISYQDFRAEAPMEGTLASIGDDHVIASTVKGARFGEGIIVRLQEIAGRDEPTVVKFVGRKIKHAWRTDLLERDLETLRVRPDGSVLVSVPPWGLATVRCV